MMSERPSQYSIIWPICSDGTIHPNIVNKQHKFFLLLLRHRRNSPRDSSWHKNIVHNKYILLFITRQPYHKKKGTSQVNSFIIPESDSSKSRHKNKQSCNQLFAKFVKKINMATEFLERPFPFGTQLGNSRRVKWIRLLSKSNPPYESAREIAIAKIQKASV